MMDRDELRQTVIERLVTGSPMDEIAAARLVSDLIDSWRPAPATTFDPVTGRYPPRENVTDMLANMPSADRETPDGDA